jgi:hypothetical protein
MRRTAIAAVTAMIASMIVWAPAAEAAKCPPATVGGKTVANVNVNGKVTPLKSITYRRGGPLDPPHTNKAGGLSRRNAPLHAKRGATVITWHVRYGPGCNGTLNALTKMPMGSTFTVGAAGKDHQTYKLVRRETVKKGVIKKRWFDPNGPHRLVLITCNDLQGNYFAKTMAMVAVPVKDAPTTSTTSTASGSSVSS